MQAAPKWFKPVAIVALLWNALGCVAYLSDVMMTPEDLAALSEADQALYAARPTWVVAGSAFAVWAGALGSLGLILRKSWATPVLMVSLAGVVVQDIGIFVMAWDAPSVVAVVLQGLVLVIAVALVVLGRKADSQGWLS